MNTPLLRAPQHQEKAPPSPIETRKRPKYSPRRAFSAATRAFLTLALATCAFGAAASAQTITITSPPGTGVNAASSSTFEGDAGTTAFEFTVSIDQLPAANQTITVPFTVNSDTATGNATGQGADFANGPGAVLINGASATSNTLTFTQATGTTQTITVPVTGDTLFEADERFTVTLTSATGGGTIVNGTAQAFIRNDDAQPFISISDAAPVTEGNVGATNTAFFTVSLSQASGQDVTFTYNTIVVDANNAGPNDFQVQNNQVGTITRNNTSTTIAVPITGDIEDEADGQFVVEISNAVGATITNNQGIGTILDDDGPTASVVGDPRVSEGEGVIVFTIRLSKASPQPVNITYTTGSNSARIGQDYGPQGANAEVTGTVSFAPFEGDPSNAGAVFETVEIPIIDDTISEPTEIFNFTLLSGGANATVTGPGSDRFSTGTIEDNDGIPNLTVSAPTPVTEGNAGNTTAIFTVRLTNQSSTPTTFRYQTVDGSAVAPGDYTAISQRTVTIPALQTTFNISVNVIGDLADEPNETFGLRVISPNTSLVTVNGGTEQTAFATIIDDDGPNVAVAAAVPVVKEGDNGARTPAAFNVTLDAASTQTVTVNYTLGRVATGEATRGVDYTGPASGTLTFTPGTRSLQVPITIVGDLVNEGDEIITLALTASNGGTLPANATATITISDDDAQPVISFVNGPTAAREGSSGGKTNFIFRVALDRASSSEVTVNYAVTSGTATIGQDFDADTNPQPLRFPAGTIGPLSIIVPVTADRLNEDDETFNITLSSPVNARIGGGTLTATIQNDDLVPALSIRDVAGLETGDPPPQGQQQGPRVLQFPVTLSAPSGKVVTVNYQTVGALAGNPYTALSGVDFTPGQGQLTFQPGQTTPDQPLNVTITGDTLDEDDETFAVILTNVTNANFARAGAIGSISDDDAPPAVNIDPPAAENTAIEPYFGNSGRNAIFPVTLSVASGRTVTVRYTISPGANPGATNNDFLVSPNNPNAIFQTGILTFTPINGATPTAQSIVLFPRGADGNEPLTENYVVNITAINGNVAPADSNAASTILDRDPSFTNYSPNAGYQSFSGVDGTLITLTGDQFTTEEGDDLVDSVRITGPSGVPLEAPIVDSTATTRVVRVPQNALTGVITVLLRDGRVLNTTAPGSFRFFFVQPVVTSFSPTSGIPANQPITIRGLHFRDPRNPVTEVRFGDIVSNAQTATRGITIVNDTTIIAYVPRNAVSAPISIRTANGGIGPGSADTFTVNSFNTGAVSIVGADTSPVFENATAIIANGRVVTPVRTFNLRLGPATENNGANTPINPRNIVDVTVTLTSALADRILPQIQLLPNPQSGRIEVGLVRATSNNFTFRVPAGFDVNRTIPVGILFAGDDFAPPVGLGSLSGQTDPATGQTFPAANSGTNLTFRAEITASQDTELYPIGGNQQIQFERRDIHTFATDTGTILRTNEDPNSANNRTNFALNLANLDFPNPDGTPRTGPATVPINVDARPKADVNVTLTTSDPGEGRLTYYVLVNGQKVYPSGAQPQNTIQVIYATNAARAEYYRNPHFIEVIGQDDLESDGDVQYRVTATNSTSTDPEYNVTLQLPFVFVNTDNEQTDVANDPGFVFSKTNLVTDENGREDLFTTSLRTIPTGNVTINFRSTRVDEVLFVNPNNPTGPGVDNISITYLRTGTGDGRTSTNYATPIVVRVRGVDDDLRDGDTPVTILTSVTASTDAAYASIDPQNLTVTNNDNEGNGITVLPSNLNVNENETSTFSIRLNSRPTSAVTIQLATANPNIATIQGNTSLIFGPDNFSTPQTVTVRGLPDGTFVPQRTATIITTASSQDTTFNNIDVADVTVTVLNTDSAFVVNAASTGLRTSEGGTRDVFTVSLGQAPLGTVNLILSVTPASEARLSRTTTNASPTVTLSFNQANYATPQTVNVIGQDDTIVDGDKAFTIIGRVDPNSTSTVYQNQTFNPITGINTDNDNGTGGGGGNANAPTFAANSTYTFSMPFGNGTGAVATIPVSSLFTQTATDYKIYGFNVAAQKNNRAIGQDFTLLPSNAVIHRGIGYVLQTGPTALTLKTPPATQAYVGSGYSFVLTRNPNFVSQTGQAQANNGLNFIGFPFNPAQFSSVSFSSALVNDGTTTYQSVAQAAAAGVISSQLYTMNANGQLVAVTGDQVLRPYGAYFVRVFRDRVTLTLRSPSPN